MKQTSIEWCDHTWSPWRGCTKVSPGCANCYAEKLSKWNPSVLGQWGKGKPRVLAKNWKDPVVWNRTKICTNCGSSNKLDALVCKAKSCAHFEFRKPRVFPSLCDWLDEEVPNGWLEHFIELILRTPNLNWLLLSKRPEEFVPRLRSVQRHCTVDPNNIVDRIDAWISGDRIPLNVWVGTSVEDQQRADERIPELLKIPARLRFLSVEPMLRGVDLMPWLGDHEDRPLNWGEIDWVIVGGESGHGSRPCNVEWIRSIIGQCDIAGVPCFVKQVGSRPFDPSRADNIPDRKISDESQVTDLDAELFYQMVQAMVLPILHPKGGDPEEWPNDLRVRQFPEVKS